MRKSILHGSMLCGCLSMQLFFSAVNAQESYAYNGGRKVTKAITSETIIAGKVTSSDGKPLGGVSVVLKGSRKGTSTDIGGVFTIAANKGDVLIISIIGYQRLEVKVGEEAALTIVMSAANEELTEVVVTALGVRRERRSLGYSVTEIKGEELTKAREVNVLNGLEGKVAGLNVSPISGGPGASSNILIRGVSSLGQTNQPLYVINGVPIENNPSGTVANGTGDMGTQYDNAPDLGDAIGQINPDDIESISVLKGAAASALYGYRAKAGVILITTKSAKGNSIEVNSNAVAETVYNPTHWQDVYGQGGNNIKPADQLTAFQNGQSSYGAKLDGLNVVQFDGVSRPYVAQKNNLENFYRTGTTFTNTIAFNKSFDGGAVRFSANDVTNSAIIPNSGLNRQSFNLSTNYNLTKNLAIDIRMNYLLEQAKNRPFLSDGPGNANFNVMFLPTSVDVNVLKKTSNPDGTEYAYTNNIYATNPWFAAEKFINNTDRDRLITSANLRYTFDDGLFIQGRAGRDAYTDQYDAVVPNGTAYRSYGQITLQNTSFADLNLDGLIGKTFHATPNISITPNIGASYRRTTSNMYTNSGDHFAVPFVYNILNATQNKSVKYYPSDQEVQSVYGTLELAYKNILYLNGSLRNDWFSTLATPGKDNKLNALYPSVSGSFVFTDLVKATWLSFGKLRAGYAVVGQATIPYQTQLSYTFNSATLGGLPLGTISNTSVPNSSLMASEAKEFEIGTELHFMQNRLSLDLTYYDKKSSNEILPAPASISSGYVGAVLNIGELQNKGLEVLVSGAIVKAKDFGWTSSVNASLNNNKVIALAAGASSLAVGTSRTGNGFTQDIVGLAADQVMAFDYKYDAHNAIVVDPNTNIPMQGDLKAYGSAYAKWNGGWSNEFTYKRLGLSFLIDGKFGGRIFSATDFYGYYYGLHKATLVNREGNFGTTANPTQASTYYSTLAQNVSRLFVQDASFIKFRQVAISYSLPARMFNNVIQGVTISLVGRNLFYLMKRTDNIDPEAAFTANAQGLELGGVPPSKTYGLNLNFKF
jgi:TonB-linked SusC/RagA family outer membrane protein